MDQVEFWRDSFRPAVVWTPGLLSERRVSLRPSRVQGIAWDFTNALRITEAHEGLHHLSVSLTLCAPRCYQTPASLDLWHLLEPTTFPPAP